MEILTSKVLTITECGLDEHWLRDRIYEDPTILGLGDLQAVMKEKTQSQGGRLDLLLKNPEDDSMFETELQLGRTDESHIIRTIEYWDNERRRWPNRSHTAVLVAEEITSRFYNVVRLLSNAIPMIGIAVNIVEVGGQRALHFTTIIDTYEEQEVEDPPETFDEKHWLENYPWVLNCAKWYRDLLTKHYGEIPMKFFRDYMVLAVGGLNKAWLFRRKSDRALLEVKYTEGAIEEAVDHLSKESIAVRATSYKHLSMNVNLAQLEQKKDAHDWVAQRIYPKHHL